MNHSLNYKLIARIYGIISIVIGIAMIPAVITAFVYSENVLIFPFSFTAIGVIIFGGILASISPDSQNLKLRDGFLIVGFGWILMSFLGCLPYLTSEYTNSFCSAFFESAAGFTTTGATVMNIDIMPKSIQMWRAISHWLGGMGVLVFTVSFLPKLGAGGQKIFKAEATGISLDKTTSRISDSARVLYMTYITFTVIEFILLSFTKMTPFDSIITTLGSISTGGLFAHSAGIAYLDSVYIEVVISVFTIFSSVNYAVYACIVRGRFGEIKKNTEVKVYLGIIALSTIVTTLALYITRTYETFGDSLRYGFFQVASFASTSGYAITNYTTWPTLCLAVFFILMLIGGCVSSTAGGIKVVRVMILFKVIRRSFYMRIHPKAAVNIKIGEKTIPPQQAIQVSSFVLTFAAITLFSALILSLQGTDIITNLSTAVSMLSSTGIALGKFGASGNFSMYCEPLRLFLSFLMILGRLELFTLLILFTKSFWRPNK